MRQPGRVPDFGRVPVELLRSAPAGPVTVSVSLTGRADHSSIAAALAAAPDGATIVVDPGTYAESLVFHQTATVVAASSSGAVTVEAPTGPAVNVAAGSAALRQGVLRGHDARLPAGDVAGRVAGPGS